MRPLFAVVFAVLSACASRELGDPGTIAARLPGTWRTSPGIVAAHLRPEERPEDEVPAHTMELVRDDSVRALVPASSLSGLEVLAAGYVRFVRGDDGEASGALFFAGTYRGQPALLTLGRGIAGPYSDSDEAFVRLRPGSPDVLVVEFAVRSSPRVAYERVTDGR